jgi:uncharacterized repeat protein (TIGR03803 family)
LALTAIALLFFSSSAAFAGIRDFVLYTFSGPDGVAPNTLIRGAAGGYYGTTGSGGAGNDGTVFELDSNKTLTTLYSFSGADGSSPNWLIQAADGSFYGTTASGGANGRGTVFRMSAAGVLTTLYAFAGNDGATPNSLIQASDGNFYGTTVAGGPSGDGTIFVLTPAGVFTTLYAFDSTTGAQPAGALVQGSDGAFYGAANTGGLGGGTLFRIDSAGNLTTLYVFGTGSDDGGLPEGALVADSAANLYGTATATYGSVFKLTPSGVYSTVYTVSPSTDASAGAGFEAGLALSSDGNFYGATTYGGSNDAGTVFRITPDGKLTTLYAMEGGDGTFPTGPLAHGNELFIAEQGSGSNNDGVIDRFPLNPPLPQVEFTISTNRVSVSAGGSANLSWSTSDAAVSCHGSGDWTTLLPFTSGFTTVTPTAPGEYTYVMTCTGASGSVTKKLKLRATR